jgi:hypothetical protein
MLQNGMLQRCKTELPTEAVVAMLKRHDVE